MQFRNGLRSRALSKPVDEVAFRLGLNVALPRGLVFENGGGVDAGDKSPAYRLNEFRRSQLIHAIQSLQDSLRG